MTNPEKQLKEPLKNILNYKPKEAPKKPEKQPSKKELEEVYVFDGQRVLVK